MENDRDIPGGEITFEAKEEEYQNKLDGALKAFAEKDYRKSEELFSQTLEYEPLYEKALTGLIKISYIQGDISKTVELCARGLERNCSFSFVKSIFHLNLKDTAGMLQLTKALYSAGLYSSAGELAERLLELPLSPEEREQTIALRESLQLKLKETDLKEEPAFQKAARKMKSSVNGAIALIAILTIAGIGFFIYTINKTSIKSGLTALDRASQLKEQFISTELHEDRVLKQLQEAGDIFERVAKDGQKHERALARFYLARVFEEKALMLELTDPAGNRDKCLEYRARIKENLNLAIKEDQKYPEAHLKLSQIYIAEKKPKEAKEEADKAISAIENLGEPFKSRTNPLREKARILLEEIRAIEGNSGQTNGEEPANPVMKPPLPSADPGSP